MKQLWLIQSIPPNTKNNPKYKHPEEFLVLGDILY